MIKRIAIRAAVATTMLAAAVMAEPAIAWAGSSASAVLGATTVLSGNYSAGMTILLPNQATISDLPIGNPDITAAGDGRFIGFVLRPSDAAGTDGSAIVGGQLNWCYSAGCTPTSPVDYLLPLGSLNTAPVDGSLDVPAGSYDLYFITDGGPATLTLHLGGLSGTSYLTPSVPISAQEYSPTAEVPTTGAGPAAYEAGSSAPIGNPSGVFFVADTVSETAGAAAVGQCLYHAGPPVNNVYASPECPESDGAADQPTSNTATSNDDTTLVGGYGVAASANWTVGGYAIGAAAAYDFHLVTVALTYDPADLNGPGASVPEFQRPAIAALLLLPVLAFIALRRRRRVARKTGYVPAV
ncbi:MAG: hypothetical protein ACYCO3_01815 [Mycobacteriales bacterium]